MKYRDFRKKMLKPVFNVSQAQVIAFNDEPEYVNLQLHEWWTKGDLLRLKRGVYMFKDSKIDNKSVAQALCGNCYFSLEYVLNFYGILPEAVFTYTLVTTKTTKRFETPVGTYSFRKISKNAFTGFNYETLLAEKEKALVDFFYLNQNRFMADFDYWRELRLNTENLDFKKIEKYAQLFKSTKLSILVLNFKQYASSNQNY